MLLISLQEHKESEINSLITLQEHKVKICYVTCNDLKREARLKSSSDQTSESITPINLIYSLIPFIIGNSLPCSSFALLHIPSKIKKFWKSINTKKKPENLLYYLDQQIQE